MKCPQGQPQIWTGQPQHLSLFCWPRFIAFHDVHSQYDVEEEQEQDDNNNNDNDKNNSNKDNSNKNANAANCAHPVHPSDSHPVRRSNSRQQELQLRILPPPRGEFLSDFVFDK